MITAIVQFGLPKPVSLEEAAKMFESTAPKYQNLPGLVRKYYVRSEDGRTAGGIYLWQSRAAADIPFTPRRKHSANLETPQPPGLVIGEPDDGGHRPHYQKCSRIVY